MTSSGKEDQDQSKINGIEDSKTTIEFLRGRLLAERSVSRTAKQRADELAQRVLELEEQLKVVCLQRKKAEKATAAVLSILEDHAIDDVSEEFSSGSDKETILSDSKDAENKTEGGEIFSSAKEKDDDADTFSSSEIASSSSTVRSSSWKSGKGSLHSLDRRKYTNSSRRRCNFSSTGISSPKRAGNSCQRIRRRDTRSTSDKLQNSSAECASEGLPNSVNNEQQSLMASAGNSDANDQVRVSASGVSGNGRQTGKSDEDRQTALHQQAQLIGQYEAEEKAQKEWEEKYGESNSHIPDSCDPENYSDVTEEKDDLKGSQEPCFAGRTSVQNHANKSGAADVSCTEQKGNINNSPSTPHVDMNFLEDKKGSRTVESDAPALEVARLMCNGNYLKNHSQTSTYSRQQSFPVTRSPMHPRVQTTSCAGGSSLQAGQTLQTGYELALVSHNTSNGLGSVLGELEKAKLSLSKQINSSGTPASYPALFKLPTDNQLKATTTARYPVLPSRSSSANYSPEPSTYETSLSPYVESRSNYVTRSNRFTYPSPRALQEVSSSAPSYRPISETNFDALQSSSMSFNPNSSSLLPFSSKFTYPTHPIYPDVVPKLPSGEVFSRNFPTDETTEPSSFSFSTLVPEVVPRLPSTGVFSRRFPANETGIPPSFSASHYDPHNRPNMYSS